MGTRERLEAVVDELGPGEELVRFAESLDEHDRALLQEILIERSGGVEFAYRERVAAKGWLRRQWDAASRPPR
jgi:hypothetical protein